MRSCGGGRATETLRQRETETEEQEQRETHGLREPDTDKGEAGTWLFQGLFVAPVGGTWWLGIR